MWSSSFLKAKEPKKAKTSTARTSCQLSQRRRHNEHALKKRPTHQEMRGKSFEPDAMLSLVLLLLLLLLRLLLLVLLPFLLLLLIVLLLLLLLILLFLVLSLVLLVLLFRNFLPSTEHRTVVAVFAIVPIIAAVVCRDVFQYLQ